MSEKKFLTKIETCPLQDIYFETKQVEMNDVTPDRECGAQTFNIYLSLIL